MEESSETIPIEGDLSLINLRPQDVIQAMQSVEGHLPNLLPNGNLLKAVAESLGCTQEEMDSLPENPIAAVTAIPRYIEHLLRGRVITRLTAQIKVLEEVVDTIVDSSGRVDYDELVKLVRAFAANLFILDDAGEIFYELRAEAERFGYYGDTANFATRIIGKSKLKGRELNQRIITGARVIGKAKNIAAGIRGLNPAIFSLALATSQHPLIGIWAKSVTGLYSNVMIEAYKKAKGMERDVEYIDKRAVGIAEDIPLVRARLAEAKADMVEKAQEAARLREQQFAQVALVTFDNAENFLANSVDLFNALRKSGIATYEATLLLLTTPLLGGAAYGAGEITKTAYLTLATAKGGVGSAAVLALFGGILAVESDAIIINAAVQHRFRKIVAANMNMYSEVAKQLDELRRRLIHGLLGPGNFDL